MDNQETMTSLMDKIQELLLQTVAKGEIKKLKRVIETLEDEKIPTPRFYRSPHRQNLNRKRK